MGDDLIPLATLSWSPSTGWPAELIVTDDVGRECVDRATARALFAEHREQQGAAARKRAQIEERVIEADRRFRASLPAGIPAAAIPEGLTGGLLMMAADPMQGSQRRESMVEHALGGGGITFHPVRDEQADQ